MSNIEFMIESIQVKGIGVKCDAKDFPMVMEALRVQTVQTVKEALKEGPSFRGEALPEQKTVEVEKIVEKEVEKIVEVEKVVEVEKIVYLPAGTTVKPKKNLVDFEEAKKKPRRDSKWLLGFKLVKKYPEEIGWEYEAHVKEVLGQMMPDWRYLQRESNRNHSDPAIIESLGGELSDGRVLWMKYPDYWKRQLTYEQFQRWMFFELQAEDIKAEKMRLMNQYLEYVDCFEAKKKTPEELDALSLAIMSDDLTDIKYDVITTEFGTFPSGEDVREAFDSVSNLQDAKRNGLLSSVDIKTAVLRAELLKERRDFQQAAVDAFRKFGAFYNTEMDSAAVDAIMSPDVPDDVKLKILKGYADKAADAQLDAEVTEFMKEFTAEQKSVAEHWAKESLAESEKRNKEEGERLVAEAKAEKERIEELEKNLAKRRAEEEADFFNPASKGKIASEPVDMFADEAEQKPEPKPEPKQVEKPKEEPEDMFAWLDEALPPVTSSKKPAQKPESKKEEPKETAEWLDEPKKEEVKPAEKPKKTKASVPEVDPDDPFGFNPPKDEKKVQPKVNKKTLTFGGSVFDESAAEIPLNLEELPPSPYDLFDVQEEHDLSYVWKSPF